MFVGMNDNLKYDKFDKFSALGCIRISQHKFTTIRLTAKSSINFFETPVILDFNDEYIRITRPNLDYTGKTIKMTKAKSGWYQTTIRADLPKGRIEFDEDDSNDDELIAYFK